MRNVAAMLYCPNPTCQASNPADQKFCQNCAMPLPHRYLWALGEGVSDCQPGTLVADRYLCRQPRIFFDTKPGLLSSTYYELPDALQPYLRLTAFQLHVPQVYDWIAAGSGLVTADLFLLDAPIVNQPQATPPDHSTPHLATAVQILPAIATEWQSASPLRQLNWLWQIANLWQALSSENAVATLLNPNLIRVEGALIRLLELQIQSSQPTLADLGQFWLQWAQARSEISGFLTQLCQSLMEGEIHNAELLLGHLDAAIAQLSSAQTRQVQIATLTDQGPTRQRNEDACYPASGLSSSEPIDPALLIVCDGIGGHQGGDVASHLAINTLEQRIKALNLQQLDSVTLQIELEKAVCAANDQISQRNDSEHRFDRQRMGTTVVMALTRSHELYITHVGDSRAYWITRQGCHQITLDDDVASREVRLGYSFYRQALHQPSAGSLVQALGMGASTMLYPTVQRFIPDEDGVFLLCSDGLSDNDRVEEVWQSEILPLLEGKAELATVCQRLVEVANTRNGYDNVTIGLVLYRVSLTQSIPTISELPVLQLLTSALPTALPTRNAPTELVAPATGTSSQVDRTGSTADLATGANRGSTAEVVVPESEKAILLPLLILIGILIGAGGFIALMMPNLRSMRQTTDPVPTLNASPSLSPAPSTPSPTAATSLEVGSFIQLSRLSQAGNMTLPRLVTRPASLQAVPTPSASPTPTVTPATVGEIPIGTVLEVLRKQTPSQQVSQQESWIELRVCSITAGDSPESPTASPAPTVAKSLLQTGQTGWIREADLLPIVTPKTDLTPEQQQACS